MFAAVVAALIASPGGQSTAQPEPTDFVSAARAAIADPGLAENPTGANDWSCRPATGTRPVVLLHGSWENSFNTWAQMAGRIARSGRCVFAVNYGDDRGASLAGRGPQVYATAPIPGSAHEVSRFVDRVLAATGADQVDVVGHSQGGVVALYYLTYSGGRRTVHNVVALGSSYRGVTLGGFDRTAGRLREAGVDVMPAVGGVLGQASRDRLAGSPLLRRLNAERVLPVGVLTNVSSRDDELNKDLEGTQLPGGDHVSNVVLQDRCAVDRSGHFQLPYSPFAQEVVVASLAQRPVDPQRCRPVRHTF
ncbi:esterase/lipase family protein [Gordonia aichiensis]|uniref:esterase/lipase family protein n=1 Tax=Gordonia aichiensis TaxID=36820 RepID=UPI003263CD9E